jgi:hypothetical protein
VLITVLAFLGFAVLFGWITLRAPNKWVSVLLGGVLALVLVLGFAAGLADLLHSYATANMPVVQAATTGSTDQAAHVQQIAGFCDDCHAPSDNSPRASQAVSLSGDSQIVFMPIEIFNSSSGVVPDEITAYTLAPGPDLQVVVSNWSEADFVKTIHEGKDPEGHALGYAMPWRDIGTHATDDDLRAYYEYLQGRSQIAK